MTFELFYALTFVIYYQARRTYVMPIYVTNTYKCVVNGCVSKGTYFIVLNKMGAARIRHTCGKVNKVNF